MQNNIMLFLDCMILSFFWMENGKKEKNKCNFYKLVFVLSVQMCYYIYNKRTTHHTGTLKNIGRIAQTHSKCCEVSTKDFGVDF